MGRASHVFTVIAAIALVILVAVIVLWTMSYRSMSPPRLAAIGSARGSVYPALRLVNRPSRAVFVAMSPGRVLLVEQTAAGLSAGETADVSHCGMLGYSSTDGDAGVWVYWPANESARWFGPASAAGTFVKAPGSFTYRVMSAPLWMVALAAAVMPGWWLRQRWIDRRRARVGLCASCGYDLRAHATGERCPECGAAIAAAPV